MDPATEDSSLVTASQGGDLKAFGHLILRYQAGIRACLAMRLPGPHDAEDLAQEVFLTAFRRLDSFDSTLPLGPWLRGIAFNLLRNHLKKRRAVPVGGPDELEQLIDHRISEIGVPDHECALKDALELCLARLGPRDRDLLHRRYHEEIPVQKLAKSAGCGTSTITMQLHRLRAALAACIRSRLSPSL